MEQIAKRKTGVVVVVYHPDEKLLNEKLQRLGTSSSVVVVDNTPDKIVSLSQANVAYIPLHKNTGIANAQNEGIVHLSALGCSHIVFFDQDSDFGESYVDSIVAEYERIGKREKKLFVLGPRVVDKTSGEEYHSVLHAESAADDGFVTKREIISSGSCVSVEMIKAVGMMDASLFIDYVDFEYCWRAESKGLVCGITNAVALPHKVGSRELHFPHGYRVIVSAPFRYYYQYRNYLWLCRRHYVPTQWKVNKGVKLFLRLFYLPFCVNGGRIIWKYMFKGIYEGLFERAKS